MCFPLAKTTFELNFSLMDTECCSAMQVHFTHCVKRDRFDVSPKREAISRRANLFRGMFQVVNMIVTKSCRFVSGILKVRFSIDSGLRRRCSSGSSRSMYDDSMLKAKSGLSCSQMYDSRLLSMSIAS